jgi:regulator of PEP synthase PpsR (kinase-PPPase family)
LSLHYGLYVANYPLTDKELEQKELPPALEEHKQKLFGLTIDPYRLLQIRQQRYQGSKYSMADTCQREIAQAENLYRRQSVPYLNTTRMSVEEIGAMIVHRTKGSAPITRL